MKRTRRPWKNSLYVSLRVGVSNWWYLSSVPPTGRVWHKAFLRWVQTQDRSPHAPGISKNASNPVGIPLKGAPQVPGDKPNPSEEG